MEFKNKYILRSEVKQLLDQIPKKYIEIKQIILLVYEQGYKTGVAIKEAKTNLSTRTIQRLVKKYSNNLITFRDLRRSYLYSNPHILDNNRKSQRKPINPKLRWEILCRDNFRCVACGKSSTKEILHVDHIIPMSLRGDNKKENLRTLCGECNMGRGNTILDLK